MTAFGVVLFKEIVPELIADLLVQGDESYARSIALPESDIAPAIRTATRSHRFNVQIPEGVQHVCCQALELVLIVEVF